MSQQIKYSIIFTVLILTQVICIIKAHKSEKPIKKYISKVNLAVILPLWSNLIIIGSHNRIISIIGYYLYYIGMTLVMVTLVAFTNSYCQGIRREGEKEQKPTIMYIIGTIDLLQMGILSICNKVFLVEPIIIDNKLYYKSIPLLGLTLHRIIDYVIFGAIILMYIIAILKTAKIYREKFYVILTTLFISGLAQGYYITANMDIDKSVIIHSIFILILFYLALYHRPLRLLDTMLSNVVSDMNDAIFVFNNKNECIWANDVGYNLLNIPIGKTNKVKPAIKERFGDLENRQENWIEDVFLAENKEYFIIEKKSVKTDNKLLDGSFLVIKDSTARRIQVEKELYDSSHDSLTKLYNAPYLYSCIEKTLHTITSIGKKYCVIYIDIKNFKIVNDIFGKKFGDQVLIQVADWLRTNMKSREIIYGRLVGDIFGIFMPVDLFDEQLFLNKFSNFIVSNNEINHQIYVHIGIYNIKDKKLDVSIMFDRAHLAIANNTDKYETIIKYYDNTIRNEILDEQKLISSLDDALKTNQIIPYLQPITDINGKVIGAEALARWIHPEQGCMPPYKFIPVFERNGLITKLDKHIWECACELLSTWKNKDLFKDLFISINISPKDFYFTDIVDTLMTLTQKYEINPKLLRIEITETVMMSNFEDKVKIFNKLRELGFIVEIDDFGSGYSSLSLLKDMPADVLKIDMKFLSNNTKSQTIIKNVINLSNDLNITSLTEGIETESQFNQLIDMGCSLFQGYYFAKPMAITDFEQFVKERRCV